MHIFTVMRVFRSQHEPYVQHISIGGVSGLALFYNHLALKIRKSTQKKAPTNGESTQNFFWILTVPRGGVGGSMVDLDKAIGTDIKRLKALIACCVFGMSRQHASAAGSSFLSCVTAKKPLKGMYGIMCHPKSYMYKIIRLPSIVYVTRTLLTF